MRVLITRPRHDAETLAQTLYDHGIDAVMEPMMTVEPVLGPPMDLSGIQAIALTSANGARAFAARSAERSLPVFAVGEATARTARSLGFAHVEQGGGDVEALGALISGRCQPDAGAILHAAGRTVAGDLVGRLTGLGFSCRRETVYRTQRVAALSATTRRDLASGAFYGVALFSPRTARIFREVVTEAGVVNGCCRSVSYCLSHAVADAGAALPWRRIVVAARPEQAALITVIVAEHGSPATGRDFISP